MLLRALGGLTLEGAEFTRPKPLLLLTYLALEGGKPRRFLADLFWTGAAKPRHSLATALSQLRTAAPGVLEEAENRVHARLACDARALLEAVEADRLAAVPALYRGPFLEGFDLPGVGVELEEWIYGTREVLAAHVRRSLIYLARQVATEGEYRAAARHAEQAYRLPGAPPPEPEQLEAMHALLVAGDHPRAAEVRDEARAYGLTFTLERAREHLREVEPAGVQARHNLPPAGTSFVGRALELLDLARHLEQEDCRLLSLVGTAGVGKTRLALQFARDQLRRGRHPDGTFFVPLDALTDPGLVPGSVAAALRLELAEADDTLAQVARFIGRKRMLLVLDNFEQLIAGAELASHLIRVCPHLKLLVTSRERLNLAEEWVYPVEGLRGPPGAGAEPGAAGYGEAAQLFHQRAKSADLRFALTPAVLPAVARICRSVEGLPLAIELAAAWTRVLPVAEIAAEIESNLDLFTAPTRGAPERHRSLRAAFAHSWGLLTASERAALRKLGVRPPHWMDQFRLSREVRRS